MAQLWLPLVSLAGKNFIAMYGFNWLSQSEFAAISVQLTLPLAKATPFLQALSMIMIYSAD
jgi:hypothetical protein